MNVHLQAGAGGRVTALPEKRFFIRKISEVAGTQPSLPEYGVPSGFARSVARRRATGRDIKVSWLSFLMVFFACLGSARADVIYSTFGPGDSYSNDGAGGIVGATTTPPVGYQSLGSRFSVAGSDYNLDKIEVAVVLDSGINSLRVSVLTDNAGTIGTPLELFTLSGSMQGNPGSVLSMNSTTKPLLQNGSSYWLVLEPGADDTFAGWWDSLVVFSDPTAWNNGAGWQYVQSSNPHTYRITANAVPEPSTLLLALGGIGVAVLRRGRRP